MSVTEPRLLRPSKKRFLERLAAEPPRSAPHLAVVSEVSDSRIDELVIRPFEPQTAEADARAGAAFTAERGRLGLGAAAVVAGRRGVQCLGCDPAHRIRRDRSTPPRALGDSARRSGRHRPWTAHRGVFGADRGTSHSDVSRCALRGRAHRGRGVPPRPGVGLPPAPSSPAQGRFSSALVHRLLSAST